MFNFPLLFLSILAQHNTITTSHHDNQHDSLLRSPALSLVDNLPVNRRCNLQNNRHNIRHDNPAINQVVSPLDRYATSPTHFTGSITNSFHWSIFELYLTSHNVTLPLFSAFFTAFKDTYQSA